MSDVTPVQTGSAPVQPAHVPAAQVPGVNGLLTLAVTVVVVAALALAREVLIPITLAVLLSFVLTPVVGLLRRIHLPRAPSVLIAVLLALGVIVSLGSLIGMQVVSLAGDIPLYATTIEQKIGSVQNLATSRIAELMSSLGPIGAPEKPPAPAPRSPPSTAHKPPPPPKPIPVEVHTPSPAPLELARRVLQPVLGPIETTLIVVIVAIFILLQKEDLRDRLIRLFGSGDLHRTTAAMDDAAHRLSRYFLSQLGINTTFGVVIGAGLAFIGVPSPILWGILAALLRFVPYIGSFIAGALPTALAAGVSQGWLLAGETAALFILVESITGQFVEPLVYGHSTGLSPISVVVAALFWTWLWGPIGLILSTPLTLCLVVLGRHVERLEFLDVMLGDRPALTPVENFYQRMLAGDPDEAQDQAELLLKERPLSSYYDEVILPGLQLAAVDARRGVGDAVQLDRIQHAVQGLVADLNGHDDSSPNPTDAAAAQSVSTLAEKALPKDGPPLGDVAAADHVAPAWRTATPVLCLAGRGPLDEAASTMLAQLLAKHGIGSRVVPHHAASREQIDQLDTSGIAMICISYLELSGSPSHLRYLLRRLRRRAPHARILVGLWPAEDEALRDERLQAIIGADDYTSSLREAVEACLSAAQDTAPGARSAAEIAA